MVSLADARARIVDDENTATVDAKDHKTRVRRLYDVANILSALGLIEKVCRILTDTS